MGIGSLRELFQLSYSFISCHRDQHIQGRYVTEHSRCGAPGVALNAPKPDEAPSGVRGNRDEAMTVNNVSLYES